MFVSLSFDASLLMWKRTGCWKWVEEGGAVIHFQICTVIARANAVMMWCVSDDFGAQKLVCQWWFCGAKFVFLWQNGQWHQKNNTRDSNVVPHRSTNRAWRCLTSLSRREAVLFHLSMIVPTKECCDYNLYTLPTYAFFLLFVSAFHDLNAKLSIFAILLI